MVQHICIAQDCDRPVRTRGLCTKHYQRWRHRGTTDDPAPFVKAICSIEGCAKLVKSQGICGNHYEQWRRRTTPPKAPTVFCTIEGCGRPRSARGWCGPHWKRWRKYGDPLGSSEQQVPDGFKHCRTCDTVKPHADFTRAGSKSDSFGLAARCKPCVSDKNRRWRIENPEAVKERGRRQHLRRYGLSEEQFASLQEDQQGVCAICGDVPEGRSRWGRLAVDHCHTSGKVRALLCPPCNTGIGYFLDDPQRLRLAADYLERHA